MRSLIILESRKEVDLHFSKLVYERIVSHAFSQLVVLHQLLKGGSSPAACAEFDYFMIIKVDSEIEVSEEKLNLMLVKLISSSFLLEGVCNHILPLLNSLFCFRLPTL